MVTYSDLPPEEQAAILRKEGAVDRHNISLVVQVVSTVRWMLFVSEAQRYDAHIRLQRWHRRVDHLADGKHRIQKAFTQSVKAGMQRGVLAWKAWAAKEKLLKSTARWYIMKRFFIHKWRVEFMGMMEGRLEHEEHVQEPPQEGCPSGKPGGGCGGWGMVSAQHF